MRDILLIRGGAGELGTVDTIFLPSEGLRGPGQYGCEFREGPAEHVVPVVAPDDEQSLVGAWGLPILAGGDDRVEQFVRQLAIVLQGPEQPFAKPGVQGAEPSDENGLGKGTRCF